MGYIDSFDVITALAAVEMVVKGLGFPIKLGSGVAKAQEVYHGEVVTHPVDKGTKTMKILVSDSLSKQGIDIWKKPVLRSW